MPAIIVGVTPKLAVDRRRRTPYLRTDLAGREATAVKRLNRVAFVLAEVSAAQVRFDLQTVRL